MHYRKAQTAHNVINRYLKENKYQNVPDNLVALINQIIEEKYCSLKEKKCLEKLKVELKEQVEYENLYQMLESVREKAFRWHRKFSISEIQSHRRCKLQHALSYVRRLRPAVKDKRYLRVGSWVHWVIEQLYMVDVKEGDFANEIDIQFILARLQEMANDERLKFETEEDYEAIEIDRSIAEGALYAYYHTQYMTENAEQNIYMAKDNVELAFTAPILSPLGNKSARYELTGRFDGVYIGGDEKQYLHEIKTSGAYGESDREHLHLDDQVTAYLWALKSLGYDVAGVIYTVIKKPGIRPRMIKSYDVENNDFDLREFGFENKSAANAWIKEETRKQDERYEIMLSSNNDYAVYKDGKMCVDELKNKTSANAWIKDDMASFRDGFTVIEQSRIETAKEYGRRIIDGYKENPEQFVIRDRVTRKPEEIELFGKRIAVEVKEIASNTMKTAYPQPAERYMNYCNMCDYRELCLAWTNQSLVEELIQRDFTNPEQRFMQGVDDALQEVEEIKIDF